MSVRLMGIPKRRFFSTTTESVGLELVVYPYLQKAFRTKEIRGYGATVLARFKCPDDLTKGGESAIVLERNGLSGEFMEFDSMQNILKDIGSLERETLQKEVNRINTFVCTPAQGRPPLFMPEPVAYDDSLIAYQRYAKQHQKFLTLNPPGTLTRLPSLPDVYQGNLCTYLIQRPVLTADNKNREYVPSQFANYICNGNAQYDIENWNSIADSNYANYRDSTGWAELAKKYLDMHDTMFMVNDKKKAVHAGIHLGANLILHKMHTDGLVWVSAIAEVLEPADRWDGVYIASKVENPIVQEENI